MNRRPNRCFGYNYYFVHKFGARNISNTVGPIRTIFFTYDLTSYLLLNTFFYLNFLMTSRFRFIVYFETVYDPFCAEKFSELQMIPM